MDNDNNIEMDIEIKQIGVLDNGIDGRDEYLLLTRKDDNTLTPAQAEEFLLPRVYRRCRHAGGYFCTSVRAVQAKYSEREVIVTVEHRYDN